MKVGTKSVLFGAHCFLIHPWFVALAWWKLYGFPSDLRLWVAFFVHDLGYWGKPNMDGPEGEAHVEWGANLMHQWFDRGEDFESQTVTVAEGEKLLSSGEGWEYGGYGIGDTMHVHRLHHRRIWKDFSLYHSRFYAKRDGKPFSQLCVADKLAVALEPWWLYLPRVIASGEITEYMDLLRARDERGEGKYARERRVTGKDATDLAGLSPVRAWHRRMTTYCRAWAYEHRDGRADTWTPGGGGGT